MVVQNYVYLHETGRYQPAFGASKQAAQLLWWCEGLHDSSSGFGTRG